MISYFRYSISYFFQRRITVTFFHREFLIGYLSKFFLILKIFKLFKTSFKFKIVEPSGISNLWKFGNNKFEFVINLFSFNLRSVDNIGDETSERKVWKNVVKGDRSPLGGMLIYSLNLKERFIGENLSFYSTAIFKKKPDKSWLFLVSNPQRRKNLISNVDSIFMDQKI